MTKPRNKNFTVAVTEDEYELFFEVAGQTNQTASAWACETLVRHALRTRWRSEAA